MIEYKCQTCCHSSVCALRENYEQFIYELKELVGESNAE